MAGLDTAHVEASPLQYIGLAGAPYRRTSTDGSQVLMVRSSSRVVSGSSTSGGDDLQ